jgi:hypothetical protein
MREFGTAESVRCSLEEDWDCMELNAGLPAYKRDCTRVVLEAPLDRWACGSKHICLAPCHFWSTRHCCITHGLLNVEPKQILSPESGKCEIHNLFLFLVSWTRNRLHPRFSPLYTVELPVVARFLIVTGPCTSCNVWALTSIGCDTTVLLSTDPTILQLSPKPSSAQDVAASRPFSVWQRNCLLRPPWPCSSSPCRHQSQFIHSTTILLLSHLKKHYRWSFITRLQELR